MPDSRLRPFGEATVFETAASALISVDRENGRRTIIPSRRRSAKRLPYWCSRNRLMNSLASGSRTNRSPHFTRLTRLFTSSDTPARSDSTSGGYRVVHTDDASWKLEPDLVITAFMFCQMHPGATLRSCSTRSCLACPVGVAVSLGRSAKSRPRFRTIWHTLPTPEFSVGSVKSRKFPASTI